jgi:hypothetical protein
MSVKTKDEKADPIAVLSEFITTDDIKCAPTSSPTIQIRVPTVEENRRSRGRDSHYRLLERLEKESIELYDLAGRFYPEMCDARSYVTPEYTKRLRLLGKTARMFGCRLRRFARRLDRFVHRPEERSSE